MSERRGVSQAGDHGANEVTSPAPVGILAGGGVLPITLAKAIIASGGSLHIVGIRGEAESQIEQFPHSWCYWGAIGCLLKSLRQAGCTQLVIVGAVRRPDLRLIRPDFGLLSTLPTVLGMLQGGDDTLLSKVLRFFEGNGFMIRGCHELAPELLAPVGTLSAIAPTPAQHQAIYKAQQLLKDLGEFDIGQAAIATPNHIIAVEGTGGTDAMIQALSCDICRSSEMSADDVVGDDNVKKRTGLQDAVLVKLPKPNQELRIDMPAIGPKTIAMVKAAGLAGVAVAAGNTLMLERQELLDDANAAKVFVAGIEMETASEAIAAVSLSPKQPDSLAGGPELLPLNRSKPKPRDWPDIEIGRAVLAKLSAHGAGYGVLVIRRYVLGVQIGNSCTDFLSSVLAKQPFAGFFPGRHGVLVLGCDEYNGGGQCDPGSLLAEQDLQLLHDAGIAGIVVTTVNGRKRPPSKRGADANYGTEYAHKRALSDEMMALAAKYRLFVLAAKECA